MRMVNKIICGDALEELNKFPDNLAQCCVTSPPYWGLRDYGVPGQLGLESTPEEYTGKIVEIFQEVKRVLKNDGTLWLNLGDCYAGSGRAGNNEMYHKKHTMFGKKNFDHSVFGRALPVPEGLKPKDLVGIPWMIAFALRSAGWYLRQDIIEEVEFYCPCGCGYVMEERVIRYSQDREIIWKKPNPMPESVTDRCTKSHEYIFLLSKNRKYYYDQEAIKEKASYNTHERKARAKIESTDKISRMNPHTPKSRIPSGWDTGPGSHNKTSGRYPKPKNNTSFDAAMAVMPEYRNKRSVWTVNTQPYSEAHFATYPEKLIQPCILAGSREGDIILDPFMGSGTTALVARNLNRKYLGIELNPESIKLCDMRLQQTRVEI